MEASKMPRVQTRALSTGTNDNRQIMIVPSFSQLLGTMESPVQKNINEPSAVNGAVTTAIYDQIKIDTKRKVFRLTIQIDKVTEEPPGKKSKGEISTDSSKKTPENSPPIAENEKTNTNKNASLTSMSSMNIQSTESLCKNGCKLLPAIFKSKPAFQCDNCRKYYIKKPIDQAELEIHSCSICSNTFPTAESVSTHMASHFICSICQMVCGSRISYNKHFNKLHVSGDSLNPYKCNRCNEFFKLKEDVRQHNAAVHSGVKKRNTVPRVGSTTPLETTQITSIPQVSPSPALAPPLKLPITPAATTTTPKKIAETPISSRSNPYHCASCNISLRTESAYKNHMNAHKNAEGGKPKTGETSNPLPISSPVAGNQMGILRAIKFTCRVCSKEFDNVGDVDKHTRTHLEHVLEEHKCNVCKKSFKTTEALADHMKHHLIRGHPCPKCSKIFINKTTLKIHMKTHNDA